MIWDGWGSGSGEGPGETLKGLLSLLPIFNGLTPRYLQRYLSEFEWFSLPAGKTLLEPGEEGEALYIITMGSLGLWITDRAGTEHLSSRFVSGQMVGELALLSGEPRLTKLTALRDTELIRIPRDVFDRITKQYPVVMENVTRQLVERIRRMIKQQRDDTTQPSAPRTIALLPLGHNVDCRSLAEEILGVFRKRGKRTILVDSPPEIQNQISYHELEQGNDLVIYLSDQVQSPWALECLRRADKIFMVARAESDPEQASTAGALALSGQRRFVELILLHPATADFPRGGKAWMDQLKPAFYHHMREHDRASLMRFVRHLTGKAVGVVFAGGGARGYAHLGVIRALREAHIPIDIVGGSSMGSIIAACIAMQWSDREMRARIRQSFVETSPIPLTDLALPFFPLFTAFYRGRKVVALLKEHFRDHHIEDLWLPFYCVSSNLTRGRQTIHREGILWQALRASIAIPGVMAPVISNGDVLVDGGVLNNFPTTLMTEFGRGPVIGIDVEEHGEMAAQEPKRDWGLLGVDLHKGPNIFNILMRAGTISSEMQTNIARGRTDLLFDPPMGNIGLQNWRSFDRAVEMGYTHAVERLQQADLSMFEREF